MKVFDVAVVGVGAMGSASCHYLSRYGLSVIGVDQFEPPHNMGSHTGESRLIRKAYFEHPDYVPLLEKAYHNWKELEALSGDTLFHNTGLLYIGDNSDFLLSGLKESASKYNIELEFGFEDASPAFQNIQNKEKILEADAGYIMPEKTIELFIDLSQKQGVEFAFNEKVLGWGKDESSYILQTNKKYIRAKKLLFTAGAYVSELVDLPKVNIEITRQSMFWMQPKHPRLFNKDSFPCWAFTDSSFKGLFYGFPILDEDDNGTVKIAHHTKGPVISEPDGDKEVSSRDIKNLQKFIKKFMPTAFKQIVKTEICYYSMTKDEHFILDFLPGHNKDVVIATGFSGHGFKFVPSIGQVLAELIIDGETTDPIRFLSLNRFA